MPTCKMHFTELEAMDMVDVKESATPSATGMITELRLCQNPSAQKNLSPEWSMIATRMRRCRIATWPRLSMIVA